MCVHTVTLGSNICGGGEKHINTVQCISEDTLERN